MDKNGPKTIETFRSRVVALSYRASVKEKKREGETEKERLRKQRERERERERERKRVIERVESLKSDRESL